MLIQSLPPFDAYTVYVVFHQEEQRNMVCLVNKQNRVDRETMSYARYLYGVKLGHRVPSDYHIDHINGQKLDDRIENLQMLSQIDNNRKRIAQTDSGRLLVNLKCPICNVIFSKFHNKTHLVVTKKKFDTCSGACSHKSLRIKYSKEEIEHIRKEQVIEIYRDSQFNGLNTLLIRDEIVGSNPTESTI